MTERTERTTYLLQIVLHLQEYDDMPCEVTTLRSRQDTAESPKCEGSCTGRETDGAMVVPYPASCRHVLFADSTRILVRST